MTHAFAPRLSEAAADELLGPGRYLQAAPVESGDIRPVAESGGNGYSTSLRFEIGESPAARLHFRAFHLPAAATLFIYNTTTNGVLHRIVGPYEGAGPLHNGEFWSDTVGGGTVIVEMQMPGEQPPTLPFEVDLIQLLDGVLPAAEPVRLSLERRISVFRGTVVEHEIRDGEAVLEGDMLLGSTLDLATANPGESKSTSRAAVGITSTYYRWPGGVIPYVVDASVVNQTWVAAAIAHWNVQLSGVISFVPRTTQTDYVRFINSSGCSSYIGRIRGAQDIRISGACTTGNIIHEMGHAVGLYHEQSREDRGKWVKILTENMQLGAQNNFLQPVATSDDLIYYGYNSIMHYATNAFSSNGEPTIETIPPGIPVGQRSGLDVSDIAAVRQMYGKQTSMVRISSVPTGYTVIVDGAPVVTPASFNWPAGSVHSISAPATYPSTAPSAYRFVRWTDGGAQTHTISVPVTGLTLAATYTLEHKLTTAVATSGTGTATASPATPGSVYANGAAISLSARPITGYCFSSWTGLATGTASDVTLRMTRSLTVKATFIPGSITPALTSVSVAAAGGVFTMNTSATTGCGWMVKPSANWITVSKTYATSSSPSFTYTVAKNTTGLARSGTILIGTKVVTIVQGA